MNSEFKLSTKSSLSALTLQ